MKLTFEQLEKMWEETETGDTVEIEPVVIDGSLDTIKMVINGDEDTLIHIKVDGEEV